MRNFYDYKIRDFYFVLNLSTLSILVFLLFKVFAIKKKAFVITKIALKNLSFFDVSIFAWMIIFVFLFAFFVFLMFYFNEFSSDYLNTSYISNESNLIFLLFILITSLILLVPIVPFFAQNKEEIFNSVRKFPIFHKFFAEYHLIPSKLSRFIPEYFFLFGRPIIIYFTFGRHMIKLWRKCEQTSGGGKVKDSLPKMFWILFISCFLFSIFHFLWTRTDFSKFFI